MNDWMDSREADHGSLAALVVIIVTVLVILGGIILSHQATPQAAAPIDATKLKENLENSPRFVALELQRVVSDVQVDGDRIVVIAGSGFARLDFEDQAVAMKLVSDIAGPGRGGDKFEIYDLATRKQVGTWDAKEGLKITVR